MVKRLQDCLEITTRIIRLRYRIFMDRFKMRIRRAMTNDDMKNRIHKIYAQFISDVDPDLLGDHLKQENVLSIDLWQKIIAHKGTQKDKCRAVLDFLLQIDHPSAFLVIRKALEKEKHYILKTIDKEDKTEANAIADGEHQRPRQRSSTIASGQWISRRVDQFENGHCYQEKTVLVEFETELQNKQPMPFSTPESITSRLDRLSARYRELKLQLESDNRTRTEELTVKLMAQIYEVEHKQKTDNKECFCSQGDLRLKLQQKEEQLLKQREKYEDQLTVERGAIEQLRHKLEIQSNERIPKIVTQTSQYRSSPQPIKVFRTNDGTKGKWIRGMTILAKELFLLHGDSSAIEVYDSEKYRLIRTMAIAHRDSAILCYIASCNQNNCIYIVSDNHQYTRKATCILKVNPSGKLIKEWSTCGDNGRLSVAYDANIILAVLEMNKLNEYTPDGRLIRELQLSTDAGIVHPWHAIKLPNNRYLVSHGSRHHKDPLHRVCIVDDEGNIRMSFGGKKGSTKRNMDGPMQLIVDGNGYIIVNDTKNARVLLLSPNLDYVQELVSQETGLLRNSRCICLDEKSGRLLVADNEADLENNVLGDGKILVFAAKHLQCLNAPVLV